MAEHETVADIRKEAEAKFRELIEVWMQRRSTFQTTLGAMQAFNNVFDRLDAAHKREREIADAKIADLQSRVKLWTDRSAELVKKCDEHYANAHKSNSGDSAKLREALETLLNLAYEVQDANSEYGPKTSVSAQFIIDVAKSALDATEKEGGTNG